MTRYFFNVWDDDRLIADEDGIEIPDDPNLEQWLRVAAAEVLAEEEWQADRIANRRFEVIDENGLLVLVASFLDLQNSQQPNDY